MPEITEAQFARYVGVQKGGYFNMFDSQARFATGLRKEAYFEILRSYSELAKKYPKVLEKNK